MSVDLDHLALRESEQIEWKENVADVNDVVRTLSAFANDLSNLGGGYVICGAAEERDSDGFPRLRRQGLTAARLKEVEKLTLARCRDRVFPGLHPLVEELPSDSPDRRILVFIQPATTTAHLYREGDTGGKHYVRISRDTVEARNGVLRDLLVRKGAVEPWDRRACQRATVADIDLLALRDTLTQMGYTPTDAEIAGYLSDTKQISTFVPSLCVKEALTGQVRPRNFTVLLFGRNVSHFIPGAVSLFSVYDGVDRYQKNSERHEISGTLLEQSRKLGQLLELQATQLIDKGNLKAPNAYRYPLRALYEALGNALAHRDYEQPDPTRITVFSNRIEFHSPGGLPLGLDLDSFRQGKLGPKWRNQALAWFFNRLQLAQAEGQGITTILRSMSEAGSPPPFFDADSTRVTCILEAHPRQRNKIELSEAESALAQAEKRLNRAKADSKLDEDSGSDSGWRLFLSCHPLPEEVWQRFQEAQGTKDRLSFATLFAVSVILTDSHAEEIRVAGEALRNQLYESNPSRSLLLDVIEKSASSGDGRSALLIMQKYPELAAIPYKADMAVLSALIRCGEWMRRAGDSKASPASRIEALDCVKRTLALIRHFQLSEKVEPHVEALQGWHDQFVSILNQTD